LQLEIVAKNHTENWRDQQFTELEAEVEAEGRRWHFWPWQARANGIRREKSLSLALRHSTERLILLEGDPGTGKSVALRHVAHALAVRATKAHSLTSKLPTYVNLKEIKRATNEAIDRELIRKFVLISLNRVNDRFVDEFIEQEFDAGLKIGTWVFLFDSFDEIPDVLSSTESDVTIEQYSAAISDFLSGINNCRGVVASRHYRGPQKAGWRTFRILELQPRRQLDLIKRSVIGKPKLAQEIQEDLAVASDDVRVLARNPMLLGLLCEHVKLGYAFPATAHEVLSKYIDYRLARDAPRVALRFKIASNQLRLVAENCAFSMTADAKIGLSPTLAQLKAALVDQAITLSPDRLEDGLSALVYMKLGRFAQPDGSISEQEFTFSHRRFQEHFATCVVLRNEQSITADQLLTDARWRETAVTLLQTGGATAVQALLTHASALVEMTTEQLGLAGNVDTSKLHTFPWKSAQLHVLRILEAGTLGFVERIPAAMRAGIGALLEAASVSDNLLDKKLALEVAGTAPHDVLIGLMRDALSTGSMWLSDVVYQQASRLAVPVPQIHRSVRMSVLRMSRSGALAKEYVGTKAYLSRMPSPTNLLSALRLAYYAPLIDFALLPTVMTLAGLSINGMKISLSAAACGMLWVSTLLIRRTKPASVVGIIGLNLRLFAGLTAFGAAPFFESNRVSAYDVTNIHNYSDLVARFTYLFTFSLPEIPLHVALDPVKTVFASAIIYAITWYITAESNIERGRYLSPLLWPFFPFLFIYDIVFTLFKNPKRLRTALSMMTGAAVFPVLLFIIAKSHFLTMIIVAVMAIVAVLTVVLLVVATFAMAMELRYQRWWRSEYSTRVDVEAFKKLRNRVKTPWVIVLALRWLADKPLIGPPAPWVRAIEDAIEASALKLRPLEKDGSHVHSADTVLLGAPIIFRALFKNNFVEQRDSLYRLLERVTASERAM
jgi:hypothetical protein